MAALTDLSDVINRITNGSSGSPESIFWYKDNRLSGAVATVAQYRIVSLWQYTGAPCNHGSVPTTAAIPDNTTIGGLGQKNPAIGLDKWLLGSCSITSKDGCLILYDRLLHCGGFSGTSTSSQLVGGTLTRNTGGIGNQIWIEIYSTVGSASTTITATYTNQSGTASQVTLPTSFGGTNLREANRMIPLPLAAGDFGVRAVSSITLAATTGSVGNFGVTVLRPLLIIPSFVNFAVARDLISGLPSITKIDSNSCLAWAYIINDNTPPQLYGILNFIEK